MSYYMHQHVFPTTNWLRWCWRAYLGLDFPPSNNKTPTTVQEALRTESNYETWNDWKEKNASAKQRLIDPHSDLPKNLDSNIAPKIFVRINMGDPMYDAGHKFVTAAMSRHAHVTLFNDTGMHCSPRIHDIAEYKRMMSLWSSTVFAPDVH
jgi:trans-aconitate methyltransferase